MVVVVQLVERQIVILVVVGSSPIDHPKNADVAKLVDALDLGSSGEICGSSSLPIRTNLYYLVVIYMLPWAVLVSVLFFWSSAFIGIKLALQSFSPEVVALFRYLIASLFIAIFFFKIKNRKTPTYRDFLLLMLSGLTGITFYNLALNYAEIYVEPAIASFFIGIVPICSLLIAMRLFQERVKKIACGFIAVSMLGLVCILISDLCNSGSIHSSLGGFVALIVAVIAMGYYSNIQRILLNQGFKPLEMTAWSIWFGTVYMLIFLPAEAPPR